MTDSWGAVEIQIENVILIKREEGAPGLWIGTEGLRLNNGAFVKQVDLNDRVLYLNSSDNKYSPGDPIKPYEKI